MKRALFTLFFLCVATAAFCQQSIKSDNIAPYSFVSISGNVSAELIPAQANSIDISLSGDADITRFKWSVQDNVLNVSLRPSPQKKGHAQVKIYYADTLRTVSIAGGELFALQPLQANVLKVSVSAGARVTMNLEAKDAEIEVTGNSVAQFSGSAKYLQLRATEKSKADTREMEVVSVEAEGATGAEIFVSVQERLITNAKTNSTIYYKGQPEIFKDRSSKMNVNVMGSSVLNIGK